GVHDLALAQRWSGLVYSGPFFSAFFMTPVWGALSDRFGQKLMLIRAYAGLALFVMLMGLVTSVEQLFVLRILQGFVSGFLAASITLVATSTPRERAGYALGLLQTSLSSGTILGPMLGGAIADFVGMRPVFYMVAAFCFLSAIIVALYVPDVRK